MIVGEMSKEMEITQQHHIELVSSEGDMSAKADTSPIELEKGKFVNSGEILKYSEEDDEALQAIANYNGPPLILDGKTNRRLLRTIDWHLMPILCCVFCLNYLDNTTLSYASIMGIKEDLDLVGDQYSWLGSIFYVGWLVWEPPPSTTPPGQILCFLRLHVGRDPSNICVNNFAGAATIRFLLGMFEAASMPAFALLSSQWYTVREHNSRTGIWISSNGWGQIVGGLVAYGISRRLSEVEGAIAGWKLIFIVTGCFTTLIGILFFWVIPDSQLNCRWLSYHDRFLAIQRVRVNEQGIGNRYFKCQLIESFGYTSQQSLLYGIPGGVVVLIACFSNGWAGDRYQNRTLIACIPMAVALVGIILIVALPVSQKGDPGYRCECSITVAAIYLIGYCVGNIIGPQTFRSSDAPRYVPAEITILVCFAVCICDLVFINWWCQRENRRKAAVRASSGYTRTANQGLRDLTDRENPEFIYSL
ncbi:uncharacterized protein N7483_008631 [Penicillium malachiteum]|uniref:uncharacterized protein n=1 Tax=Penicillium malachiteum TaxID=1324776 RepID=UPI0025473199|nr:uncharacterized protein N7483_008631 [Penicillium malachiteum]KAJ5720697.1 hypothetical protein N7483_008631 [Penicillium malachiteum]